ncbi:MAG: hypothetical protein P8163_18640, partial [Candidatus Thiodiazotropha sp.]
LWCQLAFAFFQPIVSEVVTEAEIETPGFTENIAGDAIVFCLDSTNVNGPLQDGDVLTLSVTGGASFDNSTMSIEEAVVGAGTGVLNFSTQAPINAAGLNTVTFVIDNVAALSVNNWSAVGPYIGMCPGVILSGQAIAGQAVDFRFTNTGGPTEVFLNGTLTRGATTLGSGSLKLFDLSIPRQVPTLGVYGLVALGLILAGFARRKMHK